MSCKKKVKYDYFDSWFHILVIINKFKICITNFHQVEILLLALCVQIYIQNL